MSLKSNLNLSLLLALLTLGACQNNEAVMPENTGPTPYTLVVPNGFPKPYLSKSNPLTVEGIELGKRLYNDPILSTNGRSCTSCHLPENSFSSPVFMMPGNVKMSVPAHINLVFKDYYNWDGSHQALDTLGMGDFEPYFFNTDSVLLVEKLKAHPLYPELFKKAFLIEDIASLSYHQLKKTIAMSIAQHLRTMVSSNSKFDKFRRREATLTQDEYEGYVLFFSEKADCFHCHGEPLFSDNQFHNNGISSAYVGFDQGRFAITGDQRDMGRFMTPTLRNIELTAPYMHDGRYSTLMEVIDFYDHGVNENSAVDPFMTKVNGSKILNLTPLEKIRLIAFLKTLTDQEFMEKHKPN